MNQDTEKQHFCGNVYDCFVVAANLCLSFFCSDLSNTEMLLQNGLQVTGDIISVCRASKNRLLCAVAGIYHDPPPLSVVLVNW